MNLGFIGHVHHGKSTLLNAIVSATMLSRAEAPLFAFTQELPVGQFQWMVHYREYATTKCRHYAAIDCPGHPEYMRNMIIGASQMDGAVLVVSAADGPLPGSREHLLILKAMGLSSLLVFINKCDQVGQIEHIDRVELKTRQLLNECGFSADTTPFIRGSAKRALEGYLDERKRVLELVRAIDRYIPTPKRDLESPFLMHISHLYSPRGGRLLVSGRIDQGVIEEGSEIEVVGIHPTERAVVKSMEIFHKKSPSGQAGDCVTMLLDGVEGRAVARGSSLAAPGTVTAQNNFNVQLTALKREQGGTNTPLYSGAMCQIYHKTASISARVVFDPVDSLCNPGETQVARLELSSPVVARAQEGFVLRRTGRTIAMGKLLKSD